MPRKTRRMTRRGSNEREAHGGTARSPKGRLIEEMLADWPLRRTDAAERPEPANPLYAPGPAVVDPAGDDRARPEQARPGAAVPSDERPETAVEH